MTSYFEERQREVKPQQPWERREMEHIGPGLSTMGDGPRASCTVHILKSKTEQTPNLSAMFPGLASQADVLSLATIYHVYIWERRNCPIYQDLMEMEISCSLIPEVLHDLTVHWADSQCCSQQWESAGQGYPYFFMVYHSVPICQLMTCYQDLRNIAICSIV